MLLVIYNKFYLSSIFYDRPDYKNGVLDLV